MKIIVSGIIDNEMQVLLEKMDGPPLICDDPEEAIAAVATFQEEADLIMDEARLKYPRAGGLEYIIIPGVAFCDTQDVPSERTTPVDFMEGRELLALDYGITKDEIMFAQTQFINVPGQNEEVQQTHVMHKLSGPKVFSVFELYVLC